MNKMLRHIWLWYICHMAGAPKSNRTVRYTPGEIGRVRVIEDFMPLPAEFVPREDNVKVTLSLSRRSLDFFKREARKRRVPYQRMIRALVDTYAEKQVGGKERA
jgi:predicted DNA binding CopG/RHH family protein